MGDQAQLPFDTPSALSPLRRIWGVSELLAQLRQTLERDHFDCWIQGEISNVHHAASRHCYFTLKDGQGQLRAALFAPQARFVRFQLRDGLQVLVRGRVSVYEARGELQLYVEHVEPMGRGALQMAFEQLKEKLAREGLFEPGRKRALPALPRRVGVITSPRGAAVADIIHTLHRRFARLDVLLYPVAVQGETAAGEIRQALEFFAAQPAGGRYAADVVILARGGGSLEDLWPFNDEELARTLARMPVPVISGVGHETDFTIADFVADLRAPTPTAAAELAVRPQADFLREWVAAARHLEQALRLRLAQHREGWSALGRHRAFQEFRRRLQRQDQRLDELGFRLSAAWRSQSHQRRQRLATAAASVRHHDTRTLVRSMHARLEARPPALRAAWQGAAAARRHRVEALAGLLEERNPLRLLRRGYVLVYGAAGALALTAGAIAEGEALRIRFADGWLEAEARRRLPPPVS